MHIYEIPVRVLVPEEGLLVRIRIFAAAIGGRHMDRPRVRVRVWETTGRALSTPFNPLIPIGA